MDFKWIFSLFIFTQHSLLFHLGREEIIWHLYQPLTTVICLAENGWFGDRYSFSRELNMHIPLLQSCEYW